MRSLQRPLHVPPPNERGHLTPDLIQAPIGVDDGGVREAIAQREVRLPLGLELRRVVLLLSRVQHSSGSVQSDDEIGPRHRVRESPAAQPRGRGRVPALPQERVVPEAVVDHEPAPPTMEGGARVPAPLAKEVPRGAGEVLDGAAGRSLPRLAAAVETHVHRPGGKEEGLLEMGSHRRLSGPVRTEERDAQSRLDSEAANLRESPCRGARQASGERPADAPAPRVEDVLARAEKLAPPTLQRGGDRPPGTPLGRRIRREPGGQRSLARCLRRKLTEDGRVAVGQIAAIEDAVEEQRPETIVGGQPPGLRDPRLAGRGTRPAAPVSIVAWGPNDSSVTTSSLTNEPVSRS